MRSPIIWFGGKGRMVDKLLKLLPAHRTYVEVFGGGASLLFAKNPSPVEVYNDIDSELVNFFRVLRDPQKFQDFYRLVALTPYSREEFEHCRQSYRQCENDVERAYRWFVAVRMSFSGSGGGSGHGWGFNVTTSSGGCTKRCFDWLRTIKGLLQVHERIMRVQIEHDDFRKIIDRYDTPNTLFYLDPPYIPEIRRSGGYEHEMSVEDHKDLVNILLGIKGMALLSGYRHSLYGPLEQAGWERRDYKTSCHAAGRTRSTKILGAGSATRLQKRVESVWISPNCKSRSVSLF